MNLREEIKLLAGGEFIALSCSDVLLQSPSVAAIGHNEDNDVSVGPGAYLQTVSFSTMDNSSAGFTAYSYPTLTAGNAYGMNQFGITISVNALSPKNIDVAGVPRQLLARDILNAKTVDEAVERLTQNPSACGFSVNIGSVHTREVVNVEVSPGNIYSVLRVSDSHAFHFNEYLRLTNVSQYADVSSEHRLARANKLPAPTSATTILAILGDAGDIRYPIYRTNSPPDDAATLSTVYFDLDAAMMHIYCFTNPKTAVGPLLSLPIPR